MWLVLGFEHSRQLSSSCVYNWAQEILLHYCKKQAIPNHMNIFALGKLHLIKMVLSRVVKRKCSNTYVQEVSGMNIGHVTSCPTEIC
jgi:hypothetical protein